MLRSVAVVVALLVALAACSTRPSAPALAGDWHGSIDVPSAPLAFAVHLDGAGAGTLDIPVQGLRGSRLSDVRLDGDALSMGLPDVPGGATFAGVLAPDGGSVKGTFTQNGQSFPFTMTRGPLPAPLRPQEPKAPFPYRTSDVTFPSGAVTLAGTLTEPEGPGPFPAVVLITGSGAQDRDETIMGHKPFLVIADALTKAGFAVLRTDDRGVGGSGGSDDQASYDDSAGDALAGVTFLRGRSEIDAARIGLFGHSEGGYLAPLAAQRSGGQVRFAVLMAGPAVSGAAVLAEQNRVIYAQQGATPEQTQAQVDYINRLAALLAAGDRDGAAALTRERITAQTANLPAAQRPSPQQIDQQARSVSTPRFAAFVTYDPTQALKALDVPVLAFYGDKDVQVTAAQNAPVMRQLLAGKPDATVTTLPGLNHLMQPATTGSVGEYGTIETTVDPSALGLVREWLEKRFA